MSFVDSQGDLQTPVQPNATKFERFIFDLLPQARNAIVCEVDPTEGFCAVKNAAPAQSETPEHVKNAISQLHQKWIRQSGVSIGDGVTVEINPLFAVDEQEVAEKFQQIDTIDEATYFV